ncbi:MAG: SIR2 family protein [Chloroflexi bacterium]|nr:SIR2 family protein [Chloroflexota bacterium]
MAKQSPIRERLVETTVRLLRDIHDEAEREQLMDGLGLSRTEKNEVGKRLVAVTVPPPPKPEELRKSEVFQRLVQDVRRGRGLLFLGAGVSQDVGMPSSSQLVDALNSLAKGYGIQLDETQEYDLPTIAGLLERSRMRQELVETLRDRFDEAFRSQPILPHRKGFFRLLPYLGELNRLILTTNWDDLLAQAFREAGERYVIIRRDRELPYMATAPHAVVKLHGDFTEPDTLVVSDNNYVLARNALTRPGGLAGSLWGMVSTLLAQYACIYVGYSLGDPDMNLLRLLIAARQLDPESRNYMIGPFSEEEQRSLEQWVAGMQVISCKAGPFFVALAQELAQFANRRDDLDRIFRREAPVFAEFYAPFGTGKSALLDEVERRAKAEGWKDEQIIRINLREEPSPTSIASLTECLARVLSKPWIRRREDLQKPLREKRRLFLIFDHTEAVEDGWEDFTGFVSEVVAPVVRELDEKSRPAMRELVAERPRSRLILAGRFPVEGWSFSFKRYMETFPLSPFTLSAVREMVGKYVLFSDPRAEVTPPSTRLVEQIYDITGRSHPGFIKGILDDLIRKSRTPDGQIELPVALTEEEVSNYLNSFEETIQQEVWQAAPSGIRELFSGGLCVLRKLSFSLLERLAEEEAFGSLFEAFRSPETVVRTLRECHLLAYEFPLHIVDPVIRRIQAYILNRRGARCFQEVHGAAASAWKGLLPAVEDKVQLFYFQEWLYHKANRLLQEHTEPEKRWEALNPEVTEIELRTSQRYPVGMGRALVQEIEEKDGELLDTLLECFGEEYYQKLRQVLMEKQELTR